MKSIMISIHPEWVEKIANGIKSIEIRSSAPKDWMDYLSGKTKIEPKPRTAFIYCTKSNDYELDKTPESGRFFLWDKKGKDAWVFNNHCDHKGWFNGKVVGKFTLRKVKEFDSKSFTDVAKKTCVLNPHTCETTSSCLSWGEIRDYCKGGIGYAWHISDLEIFDEPKRLNAFMKPNWDKGLDKALEQARKDDMKIIKRIENGKAFDDEIPNCEELTLMCFGLSGMIEKAPQSWRYVEAEE